MTDITLKVEQVSSTNAANDYIISLLTGYVRNLCPVLQPLTCEQADNLDVYHDWQILELVEATTPF